MTQLYLNLKLNWGQIPILWCLSKPLLLKLSVEGASPATAGI